MKAPSSHPLLHSADQESTETTSDEWDPSDPVWQLLDQASKPKPDSFFARNVLRTVRQAAPSRLSLGARIATFFSPPKIVLCAAACAAVILTFQLRPSTETELAHSLENIAQQLTVKVNTPTPEPDIAVETTDLSELVMIETLIVAAEDPSMFTRDEVLTMLGL